MKLHWTYIIPLFLAACSAKSSEEKPVQKQPADPNTVRLSEAQLKNADLKIGKATTQSLSTHLKVTGKVDVPPQNMVSVSSPLGGYLRSTTLLPGVFVKKGSVLGVLQDVQFIQLQQDYLTAKARLQFLAADYKRQEELNLSKAASDKMYQQVRSDYAAQRVLVNSLSQKLQLIGINPAKLNENSITKSINVYSPINGFVSKVNVNIGKYVSPTDVLFELVNPSDIHLLLTVFQKDVTQLHVGQKVLTYTNENPQQKFPARIVLISKDVMADGSVDVHCHFEVEDHRLLPGMYMNAEVETQNAETVVVPEGAVVRYENQQYVFEQKDDRQFTLLPVSIGTAQDGFVAVTSANAAALTQKNIVLQNAYTLLMALKNTRSDEE